MKQYDTINRFIKPKRVELANAQDRYKAKMSELKLKQDDLKEVEWQYQKLQEDLQ